MAINIVVINARAICCRVVCASRTRHQRLGHCWWHRLETQSRLQQTALATVTSRHDAGQISRLKLVVHGHSEYDIKCSQPWNIVLPRHAGPVTTAGSWYWQARMVVHACNSDVSREIVSMLRLICMQKSQSEQHESHLVHTLPTLCSRAIMLSTCCTISGNAYLAMQSPESSAVCKPITACIQRWTYEWSLPIQKDLLLAGAAKLSGMLTADCLLGTR